MQFLVMEVLLVTAVRLIVRKLLAGLGLHMAQEEILLLKIEMVQIGIRAR